MGTTDFTTTATTAAATGAVDAGTDPAAGGTILAWDSEPGPVPDGRRPARRARCAAAGA